MIDSGIYLITTPSGRRYVGSSQSIAKRWREHRHLLRHGTHQNRALQSAWRKYRGDGFTFARLIFCAVVDLLFFEQLCMDGLRPELNALRIAGKSSGWRHTEESRHRMSLAHRGQPSTMTGKRHTEAANEKNRLAHIGKPSPKRGVPLNDEQKRKIAATLKGYGAGRTLSAEHAANISAAHRASGHRPNQQAIDNSVAARKIKAG